jgi:hypothetical protein
VATLQRQCEQCGDPFETKSARARFCGPTCRSRAHRGKPPALSAVPATAGTDTAKRTTTGAAPAAPEPPVYELLADQVKQSLQDANALATIAGRSAVRVAEQIDKGRDSGSAVVSLTRELQRLRAEAIVEAAPANPDAADKIAAAAQEKLLRLVGS